MSNKVEEIMKSYRKGIKDIDKKYEVKEVKEPKKIDTSEIDSKIKYEQDFIARLKSESEENNKELIEKAQERLKIAEEEKSRIEQENQKAKEKYQRALEKREQKLAEVAKLKNSSVMLESGREVTIAQKDEMDKKSLKYDTISKLTAENSRISTVLENKEKELEIKRKELQAQREEQLKVKEEELKNKRKDLFNFKYEFDENHKITNKAEHQSLSKECKNLEKEIAKLKIADFSKELKPIEKEIKELTAMKEKCNEYLSELKETNKEFESFSKAWNEAKRDESVNEQPRTTSKNISNTNSLTARNIMEDILRIQQTITPNGLDSLLADLNEKYAGVSDTWKNRIQEALEKQREKIEENIKQSKQPKEQEDKTEAERLANVLNNLYNKRAEEQKENEQTETEHDDSDDSKQSGIQSEHDDFDEIMSIFNSRPAQETSHDNEEIPIDIEEVPIDEINEALRNNMKSEQKSGFVTVENSDHVGEGKFEGTSAKRKKLMPQLEDIEIGEDDSERVTEDESENENHISDDFRISKIDIVEATGKIIIYDLDGNNIFEEYADPKSVINAFEEQEENEEEQDENKEENEEEKLTPIQDKINETFNEMLDRLGQKYEDSTYQEILRNIDPRIINTLYDVAIERESIETIDAVEQYIESILNKKESIPFSLNYNLKNIYDTEMSLSDIKKLQNISNFAQKQNKEMVDVEKDSLPKRIFGRMKKGIQEIKDRKLLTSGENSEKRPSIMKRISKKIEEIANKRKDRKISKTKGREDAEKKHDTYEKLDFSESEALDFDDDFIIGLRDKDGKPLHIDHEKAAHNSENADDFVVAPKNEKSYEDSENDFDDYKF